MPKRIRPFIGVLAGLVFAVVLTELTLRLELVTLRPLKSFYSARRAREAKFKVVIIGDSYSLGFRQMYGGLLEQYLRERPGTEVVNLARGGWGPLEYVDVFKRIGYQIRPDLVIINAFVGSDTCSDVTYRQHRPPFSWIIRNVRRTYLGTALYESYFEWRIAHLTESLERTLSEQGQRLPQNLNPFMLDTARKHPDYFRLNLLLEGDGAEAAWARSRQLFGELVSLARESGAKVLLNVFPSPIQLSKTHVTFLSGLGFDIDTRVLGTSEPQKRFRDFCEAEHVDCYDLTPEFRKHGSRPLFLEHDDHLAPEGQRLAFRLVRAELERRAQAR